LRRVIGDPDDIARRIGGDKEGAIWEKGGVNGPETRRPARAVARVGKQCLDCAGWAAVLKRQAYHAVPRRYIPVP